MIGTRQTSRSSASTRRLFLARENNLVPVGEVQDDGRGGGGDGVLDSELWCVLGNVVCSLV